MRSRSHVFGLIVSLSLHALLFAVWGGYEGPRVVFERGAAAVTLNIMPSVASRAAAPPKATDTARPEAQPEPEPEAIVEIEEAPEPETAVEPPPLLPLTAPSPEPIPLPPDEPLAEPKPAAPAATQPQPQNVEKAPLQQQAADSPAEPEQTPAQTDQPATDAGPKKAPPDAEAAGDSEAQSVDSVDANADLREKGVDSPARAANVPRPTYPLHSRRRGEEGRAVLLVEVRPDGSVGKVEVVKSSGHRRLDQAALRAVRKATFIPARQGGGPVAARQRIAFVFRLEGIETP